MNDRTAEERIQALEARTDALARENDRIVKILADILGLASSEPAQSPARYLHLVETR